MFYLAILLIAPILRWTLDYEDQNTLRLPSAMLAEVHIFTFRLYVI